MYRVHKVRDLLQNYLFGKDLNTHVLHQRLITFDVKLQQFVHVNEYEDMHFIQT